MERPEALRTAARRLGIRKRQVFDILADDSGIDDS
jgi:hypothetical protein